MVLFSQQDRPQVPGWDLTPELLPCCSIGRTAAIDFYFMPIDRDGAGGKL